MTTQLDIDLARSESALVALNQKVKMESLQTDMLSSAHANLSLVATSLESMVSEGKAMSPVFAQTAQFSVTSISGGALPSDLISLEGYSGTAEEQTRLSLEGLKETLINIWEKIKLSIKRAIQALGDMVSKLMGGVKKIEAKLEILINRANEVRSVEITRDDKLVIKDPTRIALNGQVSLRVMEQGIATVHAALYDARGKLAGAVGAMYKQSNTYLARGQLLKPEEIDTIASEFESSGISDFTSKVELPGQKVLSFDRGLAANKNLIVGIKIVDHPQAKSVSKQEIELPSGRWVEKRCKDMLKFVVQFQKDSRRGSVKEFSEARLRAVEALDAQVKRQDSTSISKKQSDILKSNMRFLQQDFASNLTRIDFYAFSYTRAVLAVLDDSVEALEKKAEAA
jgi:hypothetical protein